MVISFKNHTKIFISRDQQIFFQLIFLKADFTISWQFFFFITKTMYFFISE